MGLPCMRYRMSSTATVTANAIRAMCNNAAGWYALCIGFGTDGVART